MGKWTCERSRLIGKCAARASGTQTAPTANPEFHSYSVTMRREVLKVTMPPPMASSGLQTAIRTDSLGYQRARHDPSAGLPSGNLIDRDVAARSPLLLGIHSYPPDLSLQRIVAPHKLRQNPFSFQLPVQAAKVSIDTYAGIGSATNRSNSRAEGREVPCRRLPKLLRREECGTSQSKMLPTQ
jgi:hypothetical protein